MGGAGGGWRARREGGAVPVQNYIARRRKAMRRLLGPVVGVAIEEGCAITAPKQPA